MSDHEKNLRWNGRQGGWEQFRTAVPTGGSDTGPPFELIAIVAVNGYDTASSVVAERAVGSAMGSFWIKQWRPLFLDGRQDCRLWLGNRASGGSSVDPGFDVLMRNRVDVHGIRLCLRGDIHEF